MASSQNDYEGNFELRQTENSLVSYNNFIIKKIAELLPDENENMRILDFGAGIGTLASLLRQHVQAGISCLEIDEKQAAECKTRGFDSYVDFDQLNGNKFDLIYTSNVLEHIQDDFAAVKDLKRHLGENGFLFIYVPANKYLWTNMDVKVGHFRRYSKNRLRSVVEAADLEIVELRYVDFLGVFALLLTKIVGFKSEGGLGGALTLRIYDKFVWPISKKIDFVAKFIIGKNLLCVAKAK